MIGLDTSVLARYLVQDDPRQSPRATALVGAAADAGEPLFVGTIVLCELVWVLESAYGYEKPAVVDVVEKILATDQIVVEERDDARAAVESWRRGRADFSDYLIGRSALAHGCDRTATFDRALKGEEGFEVIA